MRLDQYLVERGKFASRARARDAIVRGTVELDGVITKKPSQKVSDNSLVVINDAAAQYVSRAALKLLEGLQYFAYSPKEKIALDIGASTGGFTQVLLEYGAAKVHAIDVGHDQLAEKLLSDPRVASQEGLNARYLTTDDLGGEQPQFLVSDVSFISLKLALPPALSLAAKGANGLFLVKPQFEVGRQRIGKNGIVSKEDALAAAQDLEHWFGQQPGWHVDGIIPSPIKGGDGNSEFILGARKL
ncbi:TlyA family RNA methyltransferase [Polycladidibacter stylochi]|uniref:TlyA family RNA methyltransferase n=1 Tax=Polycladidibacter stylochi TaxID=1807766 RepID=UPI0008320C87|nr:TlyA family RNA methyltransferase [Pseudovibrio stylochi]